MKRRKSGDNEAPEESGCHKRPRLECINGGDGTTDGSSESPDFTRDEEYWYEDGNVILVANNVGFRVYRGLLAKRSEVFCDLFSIPQPRDGQVAYGCPVICLTETAIALRELLEVLFWGKRYIQSNDVELDRLSYRIRLAHKYGIEDLLKESIQELKKLFPTTLTSWLALQRHYSPRAITAYNLAILTDTLSIIPSAIYVCCQLPDGDLLDGASHSDGTIDMLGRDDLLRCMKAKVKLTRSLTHIVHDAFHYPDSPLHNCTSMSTCRRTFDRIRMAALSRAFGESTEAGLFEPWDELLDKYDRKKAGNAALSPLCEPCINHLRSRVNENRRARWEELPEDGDVDLEFEPWNVTDAWSESEL